MNIEKILSILQGTHSEEEMILFMNSLADKLWKIYDKDLMDQIQIAETAFNEKQIYIANASEGKSYSHLIVINTDGIYPKPINFNLEGINEEEHGLKIISQGKENRFLIEGTPIVRGDIPLRLSYEYQGAPNGTPLFERKLNLIVNGDPRKISDEKTQPTNWDILEPKYHKEDEARDYVKVLATDDGTPQKDIVAASIRGRSHGWEGKPRDDHYAMKHLDNGWYIISVADGAGSAKYSRKGSEIACETVVNFCNEKLADCSDFETHIATYNTLRSENEEEARKTIGDYIYKIVGAAAFEAHKAINAEAKKMEQPSKLYATTLLLTICKKFEFGWFVASFWVGDGAICIYNRNEHMAKLLGVPDEGEFAGQTRFLTMTEIFKDSGEIYKRLRFQIVEDFDALFLMSDGVSDPMFETDANLVNPEKWDALWDNLTKNETTPVVLEDDNDEAADQLLKWLEFWVPGHHDDRTIAILY